MTHWKLIALAAALVLPILAPKATCAQSNPDNSARNPYAGSVEAEALTPGGRKLSLNEAIDLGIRNNLALTLARSNQKSAQAEKLQLENYLLPNISLHGEVGLHQYNLAAQGFRPSLITQFGVPPSEASQFPLITKVNTRIGQINFSQALFTWSGWDAWRAAKANVRVAYYGKESALGLVVLNVGTSYLKVIAASSQVDFAQSLLETDRTLLYQAHQKHVAGTAANLVELRARVQYQQQQQAVIAAKDQLEKNKIALDREIGLPPQQQIQLTDVAPYAGLSIMSIEQARQEAYQNRQVYQRIKQQIVAAKLEQRAIKHERYPSLSFSGNYGVTGVAGLVYHGTFTAMGALNIPIFHEAKFRGDADVAQAQVEQLQSQMNDLTTQIDQQLRDNMLDLKATQQLVGVARSNVSLATTALDQSTERFKAGVDTNLPVAQAQSALAQAQAQYVNSIFQYNQSKLAFARNLGVIESQFKNYLPAEPAQ
ncbi:MAG: TolC family protein [Acidobacteriaceae bacterium]